MKREEKKRKEERIIERKEEEDGKAVMFCTVLHFKGSGEWSARPFQFQTEMGILLIFSSGKKSGFSLSSIKKSGISFKQSSVL
jgi:hypothetical protein